VCVSSTRRGSGSWRRGLTLSVVAVLTACGLFGDPDPPGEKEVDTGPEPEPVRLLSRGFSAMGTLFEITVVGDRARDEEAIEAAFDEIRRVEDLLTVWKPEAPLLAVNEAAGADPVAVPEELFSVIERAVEISERTGGAFDISFASMGRVWNFDTDRPVLPDPKVVKSSIRLIDYRRIALDPKRRSVRLEAKGMRLSLGGIAKGYAADRAAEVLRRRGVTDFAIFGGGDQLVAGRKGDQPFSVGIQDPRKPSRHFARLTMPDGGAVVTSGDYERFFVIDGKRYHHIIDPATGYPAEGAVSVTVVAKSATVADALATGLFVLGPERGMELVEADPQLEAIFVDEKLEIRVSSGLGRRVEVHPIAPGRER
jgi:thiamine biosynthesis lipoprotein